MKHKNRFPGMLWHFGKEKERPPYTSCFPESAHKTESRFWDEYKIAIIIAIIAVLVIAIDVLSFAQETQLQPLPVGEQVPDLLIGRVLNSDLKSFNLKDYKDRLLILDFWSTSCATCVNEMPNVAALAKRYAGKIKIFDIDYEPENMVLGFYRRRPEIKELGLPVAVSDKQLGLLFPHRFQPHIVWIDHGIYRAATEGGYLTEGNIDSMLNDQKVALTQKVDLPPEDRSKPAFNISYSTDLTNNQPIFSSIFTGHIQGKSPSAGTIPDLEKGTQRVFFFNQYIFNLYAYILKSPLPFQANRRILHVKDSVNYINIRKEYDDRYDKKHTYCFETVLPLSATRDHALAQLNQALGTYLGLSGSIEKLEVSAFALISLGNGPSKSAYARQDVHATPRLAVQLHHVNAAYLTELINDTKGIAPVINETGNSAYFDIDMAGMPQTLREWTAVLKQHGLVLIPGKMRLDMFVLTEHPLYGTLQNSTPTK